MCQKAWTGCFVVAWALLVVGTVMCHVALGRLVWPLQGLPSNLRKGFDSVLGFSQLESSAEDIQAAALAALAKCGVNASQCPSPPSPVPLTRSSNSSEEKDAIQSSFSDVLSRVLKVATDPYLGTDAFAETADQLQNITDTVGRLNATGSPCAGTSPMYCGIYVAALELEAGSGKATAEIDRFTQMQQVRDFEANSDRLQAVHALPYLMLLSMVFFFIFWWRDAACCCCGGSIVGLIALALHLICWLVFFVLMSIISAAGLTLTVGRDKVKVTGVVKGNPTLGELLDHIQVSFPEFWGLVFKPLSAPGEQLLQAALVFWVLCVLLLLYGSCLCCCRPYTERHEEATLVKVVC